MDGALDVVVDLNTPPPVGGGAFVGFSQPSFGGGVIAFFGETSSGHKAVYKIVNGVLTIVADTSTAIPGGDFGAFTGFLDFDRSMPSTHGGNVAFYGFRNGTPFRGIYTEVQGVLGVVANQDTLTPNSTGTFKGFSHPAMDGIRVAFIGKDESNLPGIYVNDEDSLRVVADLGTLPPDGSSLFTEFESPSISPDGGAVVFHGKAGQTLRGIYSGGVDDLRVVVDSSMPIPDAIGNFRGFGLPAIDDGRIAFEGQGELEDQIGLYFADGRLVIKIIDLSDTLDGRPLSFLEMGTESLSSSRLAFTASFADSGSQGIYIADIEFPLIPAVSEWGMVELMLLVLIAATLMLRRGRIERAAV